jgi:hypothetical protein
MPDPALKTSPALKSHRLDYAPPLTVRDRIARYLPSSDTFVGFLKTLVWVAPLTLLIWVYAEREQNVTQANIIVPIEVRTNDPNRIVTLRGPADKNVVLELYGPRAKVDHIHDLLKPDPKREASLIIDIDPKTAAGENKPTTIDQINNQTIFKTNGITVKSAQPPYLVVDIDTYEERDVQVKPAPEIAGMLSEATTFSPGMVKLRAPKSMIDSAGKDLVVYANLANRKELKSAVGAQKLTLDSVPVFWGARRENVYISPAMVTANLDIKPSDVEYTIASVPITKDAPAGMLDTIIVNGGTTISNVKVTGPREQIERLEKNEFKPKAVLEVNSFDKNGETIRRTLEFVLPPGVTLHPDSLPKANCEFTKEAR